MNVEMESGDSMDSFDVDRRQLLDMVVVITGGAGLLGRQFCLQAARHGAVAVVADRDAGRAEEVASDIRRRGLKAEAAILDIGDSTAVDKTISNLRAQHGRVDAVVNNAYPRNELYGRRLEEVTYHSFCDNVSQHLGGYFLVSQRFCLDFAQHGGGCVVNVASIYGIVAPRFEVYADTSMTMPVEYAATKAGVIQLTRYFAQYFKGTGIRVNAIAPGGVRDGQPGSFMEAYDLHGSGRGLLEAQDVAGVLVCMLSDSFRYMNGQVVVVDDGWSL